MTLIVTNPDPLVKRLQSIARASSRTSEQVVSSMIERDRSAWERANKVLAPIHAEFEASGMTNDELAEFIDKEIHAHRREQRGDGNAQPKSN